MKRIIAYSLSWLLMASQAFAQVPYFPQSLPPGTVVGRLNSGAGPTQAIPFATLRNSLSAATAFGISVKDAGYNCAGDAVTDDTACINAATAAANAINGALIFPPGTYIYKPSGNGWSPGANVHVYGYGATIRKGASGTLGTIGTGVQINGLSVDGQGATYTGLCFQITAGNDQKFFNVSITDCDSYALTIGNDVGLRFLWDGGTVYRHTNITDIPILVANGGVSETNGDREFIALYTAGRWLMDTGGSQNTLVANSEIVNLTMNANSIKTRLIGNRVATLGNDLHVAGTQHSIIGNIIAGGITLDSGTQNARIGPNVLTTSSIITDNSGQSNNEVTTGFVGAYTAGASGYVLTHNGSPNPPSWQSPSGVFDTIFGSTRGSILKRGASAWTITTPGSSGLPLVSAGAGNDPGYAQIALGAIANGSAHSVLGVTGNAAATYADIVSTAGTVLQGTGTSVAWTATPVLGTSGTTGTLGFLGSTSGTATITPQATAGTPTLTLPSASGTFAVSATSPLALSSTTGALSINTNGIDNTLIRQGVARSFVGVTGNATANVADIQCTTGTIPNVGSAGNALACTAQPYIGVSGSTGTVTLAGGTSGTVVLTPQSTAGSPTVTFGTSSGTPAVTASAPLAITAATGNIAITGVTGQVLAGSGPAFTATPTLGAVGTTGTLTLAGTTSGSVVITPQSTAGSPTFTLPNASGTPAVSTTAPLTLSATTGALTFTNAPQVVACASAINANSVADTAITIGLPTGFTRYRLLAILISHASVDLTAATAVQFGVFTATGGGGTTVLSATVATVSATATDTTNNAQFVGPTLSSAFMNDATLQFRITTAHGSAATLDACLQYQPLL